jgi:hypothetical protein
MPNPILAIPTVDEIRGQLCAAAFGSPLISNIYRGLVAEIIIGAALDPEWQLCSGDCAVGISNTPPDYGWR